jgi:hypothetical protein
MSRASRIAEAAAAAAVIALTFMAADAGAQSIIPVVELSVEPATQEVDASSGAASAVYNCSVFVEGLPLVRYRVNLTADCEVWHASCDPASFIVTGSGNNSFHTTVSVPAGEPGGQARVLTVNATVSTTGVSLNASTTYSVLTTRQSFGLNLSTDTPNLAVTAGKTASWAFALKNTGNGRDTFSLSVIDLQTYNHNNWTLKFNRTFMSVDSGDTGVCTINITPAQESKNQTVAFQIKAYSRGASYQDITVEDTLELQLSVAAAGGGDGKKPPSTPKGTPGPEAVWLLLALAMAALAGVPKRS